MTSSHRFCYALRLTAAGTERQAPRAIIYRVGELFGYQYADAARTRPVPTPVTLAGD